MSGYAIINFPTERILNGNLLFNPDFVIISYMQVIWLVGCFGINGPLRHRGVLLVWMVVGQGPIALAVGAGGVCLDIFFSHLSFLFSFSPCLGDGPI